MQKSNIPICNEMLHHNYDPLDHDINLYINSPNSHYDKEHKHTHYEFAFVVSGSLLNTSMGSTVKLEKGDIILMRPECVHKISLNKKSDYLLFNLEISSDFIQSIANQMGKKSINDILRKPINYIKCTDADLLSLTTLVQLSLHHKIEKSLNQYYLRLLSINILILFVIQESLIMNSFDKKSDVVKKILADLSNPENFTLKSSEICQKHGYSHEYVIRQFKKANLDSPNKIFIRNKMNFACLCLKTSKIKIIDIAELCGIYTINHFNNAFIAQFGISPSRYRKMYAQ